MSSVKANKIEIINPELLLNAYANGYFPMADSKNGEIGWYSPDPRAVFPLDTFKVSRSLNQTIKKRIFEIRVNTEFEKVIRLCGKREETWISEEIIQSYLMLHHLGYAHSIESFQNNTLVGGLYGVAIGGTFFGESMFSTVTNASKIALCYLVKRLKNNNFELLDTQWLTPHLITLGAIEIPRKEYIKKLISAVSKPCLF